MRKNMIILASILFLMLVATKLPILKAYDLSTYCELYDDFMVVSELRNSSGQWAILEKYEEGNLVWEGEEIIHLNESLVKNFNNGIRLNGNRYLCILGEQDYKFNEASQEYIRCYDIIVENPIKPIQRESMLPSFLYSENFFNIWDYLKL